MIRTPLAAAVARLGRVGEAVHRLARLGRPVSLGIYGYRRRLRVLSLGTRARLRVPTFTSTTTTRGDR